MLRAKAVELNALTLTFKGMRPANCACSDSEFEFVFCEDRFCHVRCVLA